MYLCLNSVIKSFASTFFSLSLIYEVLDLLPALAGLIAPPASEISDIDLASAFSSYYSIFLSVSVSFFRIALIVSLTA
jgi:hypothetical protein